MLLGVWSGSTTVSSRLFWKWPRCEWLRVGENKGVTRQTTTRGWRRARAQERSLPYTLPNMNPKPLQTQTLNPYTPTPQTYEARPAG